MEALRKQKNYILFSTLLFALFFPRYSSAIRIVESFEEGPKDCSFLFARYLYRMVSPRVAFESPPPPDFFLDMRPSFFNLKDGTTVRLLTSKDPFSIASLHNSTVNWPNIVQDIYLNGLIENSLLKFSMENGGRESIVATAYDLNGTEIKLSPMFLGKLGYIETHIVRTAFLDAANARNVKLVDLTHTHPPYEFEYRKGEDQSVQGSPLSIPDIAEVALLSRQNPHLYVRMRAVDS